MTADAQTLLDEAAVHLDAAAHLADRDNTPRGRALAGLIRLTRAGITPGSFDKAGATPGSDTVAGRIRAALTALDAVDPLDGPPDLLTWSWQVTDLLALVDAGATSRR